MKSKFTLSGVAALAKRVANAYNDSVSASVNTRKLVLIEALRLATPIDTGYARSRWELSRNDKAQANYRATGSRFFGNDFTFFVSNDADYIKYLNRGHSKQAPSFFIEQTIMSQGYRIVNFSFLDDKE